MKKVLFVATVFKFLNFEESDMNILKNMGYEIHTATNMQESEWLRDDGKLDYLQLHKHQIDFGRSPFSKQSILAYRQLKKLLREEEFTLMHCHTPVAAAIARFAAKKAHKRGMKVIYTSHGFHFHKASSKKYWLLFYPVEWILAHFSDMIIAINKEDYHLIQKFKVREKCYIPGVGVDIDKISQMEVNRHLLREKYNIPDHAFLILSIGELSDRKNHETVIRAISDCRCKDIYYLICGTGDKRDYLLELINETGLCGKVVLAGQLSHDEVLELCHVCDIGAIPSKIEGLGLAGIETLAAGKPLVASNVHGINDYVINDITGISNAPEDVPGFREAITRLYSDQDFYKKCERNAADIAGKFDISKTRKLMTENYCRILEN